MGIKDVLNLKNDILDLLIKNRFEDLNEKGLTANDVQNLLEKKMGSGSIIVELNKLVNEKYVDKTKRLNKLNPEMPLYTANQRGRGKRIKDNEKTEKKGGFSGGLNPAGAYAESNPQENSIPETGTGFVPKK